MKGIVVILCLLSSTFTFAKDNSRAVKQAFEISTDVTEMIQSIENHFEVDCGKGKVTLALFNTKFPKVVTWKGLCQSLTKKLVLTMKSDFKIKGEDISFKRKNIHVQSFFMNGTESFENDSIDPFVNAYKRSNIVKEIRRFSEDELRVSCETGKAHRGIGLYAAKYSYKTKCKSEVAKIVLKIASKVELISDTSFKFNLKEFHLFFR
jgi:hypothetical protein